MPPRCVSLVLAVSLDTAFGSRNRTARAHVTLGHACASLNRSSLAQRSPAGLFVYLTVQALALTAAFHAASVVEHLWRWQHGEDACRRLTLLVHAAAPLVYGLALYLSLAFYALIWNDAEFRKHVLLPKEAAGLPIHQWMHETHFGPVAISLLDVMGGHTSELWARHIARPGSLVAAAVAYGTAYTALCHAVAHFTGGAWPYPFMSRLTAGGRVGFCAVSCTVLSLLTLLWRRIITVRCRVGCMPPQKAKGE